MVGPHGRANIDARRPQALAVCDRCGFLFNHVDLKWQYQWAGAKLQNIMRLVCQDCLDIPQEQLRSIIIPPDPVPVLNPRPEYYVQDDNPISGIGQNANAALAGTNIGTMTNNAGTYAAFDSNSNKPFFLSAAKSVSTSSFGNWVGKNWNVDPSGVATQGNLSYTLIGFTLYAPNNSAFLVGSTVAVPYRIQGSSDGSTWTTLYSSQTDGTIGQNISISGISGDRYGYHRVDFVGNGSFPVAVAQFGISVGNSGN